MTSDGDPEFHFHVSCVTSSLLTIRSTSSTEIKTAPNQDIRHYISTSKLIMIRTKNIRTDSERPRAMSSQPSQKEVARSTVASAVQTVAETIDPSQKKDEDDTRKEPTLKEKLDRAAYTSPDNAEEQKTEETFMEKGSSS